MGDRRQGDRREEGTVNKKIAISIKTILFTITIFLIVITSIILMKAISVVSYNDGYDSGFKAGNSEGSDTGYSTGYSEGYDDGYNVATTFLTNGSN